MSFLFFGALFFYSCALNAGVKREIAGAQRDPITGVVKSLEATTLRPTHPDAATSQTACLLAHGFVGSRKDLGTLGEYLADNGYTVRLMRLPGHATIPPDFAYLPDGALYRGVKEEYNKLKKEYAHVYVVGFSMGATLATLLASEEPVEKIALAAPYYRVKYYWFYVLPPETWNAMFQHLIEYVPKSDYFVKVNDRSMIGNIYTYEHIPLSGVRQLNNLGRQARQNEVLSKIQCPLLMVVSEHDQAASPKAAKAAFAQIGSKEKELRTVNRSNHHVFWDYDRDIVKESILNFLKGKNSDFQK